jgi:hypothetical protein
MTSTAVILVRMEKHGMWNTPEYQRWQVMIQRCENPKSPVYRHYGGRGIKVCERWRHSFAAFISDMGRSPEKHELDRIDNNGDYCPENCRWTTRKKQIRNRRTTPLLTWDGRTMSVGEWADESNLPYHVLATRLAKKWPIEQALRRPVSHLRRSTLP